MDFWKTLENSQTSSLLPEAVFPWTPFSFRESCLALMRRGSEAHGTWVAPEANGIDDRDLMGVLVLPRKYYAGTGLDPWEGADAINGPWDVVLYEFRKFIRLLVKQNPNVISMLWLEPEDYIFSSYEFDVLRASRSLFRSRTTAYLAFAGYAAGQEKRMTNPVEAAGYMGAKRKNLFEKFGYDCKNAAHLIRLLSMGAEYLETGVMKVRRTQDRDLLIQIKTGQWTLDRVNEHAQQARDKLRLAYETSNALPEKMDMDAIEALTVKIVERRLYGYEFEA